MTEESPIQRGETEARIEGAHVLMSDAQMIMAMPGLVQLAKESLLPNTDPLPLTATKALREMGEACLRYGGLFIQAADADDAKRESAAEEVDNPSPVV